MEYVYSRICIHFNKSIFTFDDHQTAVLAIALHQDVPIELACIPRHIRNTRCGTADIYMIRLADPILHAIILAELGHVCCLWVFGFLIGGAPGTLGDRMKLVTILSSRLDFSRLLFLKVSFA